MRTTLLPSVLEALARNDNYHTADCGLYEDASVYIKKNETDLPDEPVQIALAFYASDADFYKLKGICEAVFAAMGIKGQRYLAVSNDPTYHPGRCAAVSVNGVKLGVLASCIRL